MARLESSGARGTSLSQSPVLFIAAAAVFLGLLIVAARLFAPDKPVTPPTSEIEYKSVEPPPRLPGGPESPMPAVRPATPTGKPGIEDIFGARVEGVPEDPFVISGTVRDEDTGKPVADAQIKCKRRWTPEEFEQWKGQATTGQKARAMRIGEVRPPRQGHPGHRRPGNRPGLADEAEEVTVTDPDTPPPPKEDSDGEEADRLAERLDSARLTYTKADGTYSMRVALAGEYDLVCFHSEYYCQDASASKRTAFKEGESEMRVDFTIGRGASISGRVTERGSGRGAPGIQVMARPLDGRGMRFDWRMNPFTDEDGNYRIAGLAPAEHEVSLFIGGVPYQFAGLPPVRIVKITQPKQDIRNIDFVVDAAGTVWGYVLDQTGKPVKGAHLFQCNSDSVVAQVAEALTRMREPVSASTDEQGYYRMCGVPLNRECRVFVFAEDNSPQLSEPFMLTDSQREARVDVYLTGGSTVYGRVVSSEGRKPVAKAQINCMPAVSRLLSPFNAALGFREETSKEDGSFTIPHLPPGEHKLYAMAEKFKVSLVGEPIFSDGYSDIQVELVLEPVGRGRHTVYGVVTDTSGRPVSGVRLSLASIGEATLSGGGELTATSDAKGNYLFEGVDEGYLLLMAEAKGYSPKKVDDVKLDEATDIKLEAAARVSGRVIVRETGQPPSSYSVRALPQDVEGGDMISSLAAMRGFDTSGTDGTFELMMPAGTYILVASAPDATPGRLQISVESGETLDNIRLEVSQSGGNIRGRVVTRDGRSPNGASVILGQEGASFAGMLPMLDNLQMRTVSVGDDGVFEFMHLPGGVYRVTARLSGYADGQSAPVTLPDGQDVGGVEIVLGSGGRLQGTVAIGGALAPGAVVTVVGGGISRMTTADRNGQYSFDGLPAGEYLASAVSPDMVAGGRFMPSHGRVIIQEGQVTVYNFGESQGATIEGLCTPAPPTGGFGFAVLRIAGTGEEVSQLDFRNLMSWFSGSPEMASSVVGLAQLDRDGWFTIENAPQGSYTLDVYYMSLGTLLSSQGRRVYSSMVNITGQETISMQIATSGM